MESVFFDFISSDMVEFTYVMNNIAIVAIDEQDEI